MDNYYFEIADIKIHIRSPFKFHIKDESKNFISLKGKSDIKINFVEINEPLEIKGDVVHESTIDIYRTKQGFIHEIFQLRGVDPYAWLIPVDKYNYEVRYLAGSEKYFEYSRNILEAINIEQVLNNFKAFLLHSSFINWQNKGILFSAPSGTGKSTQADLWNKHENAEIINGDRAGVRNVDGVWSAYGLPVAGSSGIYKNKKAQISHIIVLRQGNENKLTRLSPRDAFIKIYSETTVHTWDAEFQNNILNMISDLVQNVPVYLYECLPDESAVEFLKEQIIKDNKL